MAPCARSSSRTVASAISTPCTPTSGSRRISATWRAGDLRSSAMRDDSLLVLRRADLETLLEGQESALIDIVAAAYKSHWRGESALPQSTFLRFPHNDVDRIIALPAFL